MLSDQFIQPGDPEQLRRMIEGAEHYYEQRLKTLVVYWEVPSKLYRIAYEDRFEAYEKDKAIEVVRIPK